MITGCPHRDPEQTSQAIVESALCFAVWAYEPPEGGVLICPRSHRATVFDLNPDEWKETQLLLTRVRAEIDQRVAPDGYNVGWNVIAPGGQQVAHAHLHVVPRWSDEPYAGKGIRWWIKQPENRRPSAASSH
jgi:diadenosine tetraphosphate (Ap4A) HIT family hydrolase